MGSLIDAITVADTEPRSLALTSGAADVLDHGDLARQVRELAGRLQELGVGPGGRICVALPEGPASAVVLLAVASAGVCCPVDPSCTQEEYRSLIGRVQPRAFVLQEGYSARARRACAELRVPVLEVAPAGRLADGPGRLTTADTGALRAGAGGAARGGVGPGTGESRAGGPGGAPDPAGTCLLLQTSASTGVGKLVPLTVENVVAAASATGRAYRLGPADRRLNVMPMFHVQGFVGSLVASLLSGGSVLCAPGFTPDGLLEALAREPVTWFSASPTMHRRALERAGGVRPDHSLRFVRCGSGGLPGRLRAELAALYGVPVVESYGMTEAHQIASTPLDGPEAESGVLVPTGSRVAVLDGAGAVTREPGRRGEIVISGPNVMARYALSYAGVGADSGVGGPAGDHGSVGDGPGGGSAFVAGWLRTGDLGELTVGGGLLISGRLKDLINRGGEKVSPREVEEALLAHPGVGEAMAYGVPHEELGEEVAVAVVPAPGPAPGRPELRAFAAERLAPHKVPRYVVLLDALPTTASGKASRLLLRQAHLAAPPEPVTTAGGGAPEAAVSPLEGLLLDVWSRALGGQPVGPRDDFYLLGGESLAAAAVLAEVRERFGVEISPLAFADQAGTVADMAEYITRRGGSAAASVPAPVAVPAGGSAAYGAHTADCE